MFKIKSLLHFFTFVVVAIFYGPTSLIIDIRRGESVIYPHYKWETCVKAGAQHTTSAGGLIGQTNQA